MHGIGVAATMSGVKIETIRYYEREGVVPRPARTPSGRRLYTGEDVARLRFIRRCRNLGFSILDIRTLLDLATSSDAPCAEVRTLGERHLRGIRRKIRDLGKLEHAISDLVGQCDAGQTECPMLNSLYADSGS